MHPHDHSYLDVQKPEVSFDDVGGYESVKEKFKEMVVLPLKYPEALERANMAPPPGVIVWGPLGTGKWHLTEAAAKEAGANFVLIRGRECTDRPDAIHEGFELARKMRPCVVHVMDIDWLAPRRDADYSWEKGDESGKPDRFGNEEVHQAVIDEVSKVSSTKDIMTVGSCYRIDVLDTALDRVSMLGRKIYVPSPNRHDRVEILRIYLRDAQLGTGVSPEKIAEMSEYYVGWDLEALCRKAKLAAIERSKGTLKEVTMDDFAEALKAVKPWLTPKMAERYEQMYKMDCIHKYNF